MRALVCDWCATVTTTPDGWYEVQATVTTQPTPFDAAARTFCGLDCLADYVDDARTSPTGTVTGATPLPAEVDLKTITPAPAEAPFSLEELQIPTVEPERDETRRPVSVVALAAALADAEPRAAVQADTDPEDETDEVPVPAMAEVPPPLRGLGRGLGRTGS